LARESSFKLRLIDLILRMGRGFYRDFGANGRAWAEGHAGRPGREKTKSRSLVRQKDGGLGMTAMERGRRRDSPQIFGAKNALRYAQNDSVEGGCAWFSWRAYPDLVLSYSCPLGGASCIVAMLQSGVLSSRRFLRVSNAQRFPGASFVAGCNRAGLRSWHGHAAEFFELVITESLWFFRKPFRWNFGRLRRRQCNQRLQRDKPGPGRQPQRLRSVSCR
jgi:hypothetical protein